MQPQANSVYKPQERPGCVTVYAIFLGLGACLMITGGITGGFALMSERGQNYGAAGLGVLVCASGLAFLYGLLAIGLWQLKNWARITIIVLISLSILSSLLSVCIILSGYASYGNESGAIVAGRIIGAIIGLVISGFIVYWFATNGKYFS